MDSFFAIISAPFTSSSDEVAPHADQEKNGGAGNNYCVINQKPEEEGDWVEYEKNGGAGNNYCVIA